MTDEVTLEISADAVIVESDGIRAEVRGADARIVREQLAEVAINTIRDLKREKRYIAAARERQAAEDLSQYDGRASGQMGMIAGGYPGPEFARSLNSRRSY